MGLIRSAFLPSALTILFSVAALILISRVQRRFRSDILEPIIQNFDVKPIVEIAEIKNLEARRDQLLKLEGERAQAELATQIAHDIRSPLSALNIVVKKRATSWATTDVEFVTSIIGRINKIADDLLDKARPLDHPAVKESKIADLVSVSKKVAEEKTLSDSQISIAVEIEKLPSHLLDEMIQVSQSDWGRLTSNIVNNAIEASADRAKKVQIRFSIDGNSLQVSFEDYGHGIPAEIVHQLNVTGGTFNKSKGNGLGLKHARHVVQAVGGNLVLSSQVGVGSKILIQIPIGSEIARLLIKTSN